VLVDFLEHEMLESSPDRIPVKCGGVSTRHQQVVNFNSKGCQAGKFAIFNVSTARVWGTSAGVSGAEEFPCPKANR